MGALPSAWLSRLWVDASGMTDWRAGGADRGWGENKKVRRHGRRQPSRRYICGKRCVGLFLLCACTYIVACVPDSHSGTGASTGTSLDGPEVGRSNGVCVRVSASHPTVSTALVLEAEAASSGVGCCRRTGRCQCRPWLCRLPPNSGWMVRRSPGLPSDGLRVVDGIYDGVPANLAWHGRVFQAAEFP